MSAKKEVTAEPKKKKSKKLVLIGAGTAVVLAAGGGGAFFFMGNKDDAKTKAEAAAALPAQYYALTPAFVVNLADTESTRYLQADVQLMTRDPETFKAIELHAPAIRNRLLLLFGTQTAVGLTDRRGKEKLQQAALSDVRALLKAEKVPGKLEALYFTSLVTQ